MLRRIAVVLLLAGVVPAPVRADDPSQEIDAGKQLIQEGNELADKGETTEAVIRYKRAFERLLPVMRKLPFRHEVKRDVTAREKLKEVLIKELDEEMTPDELRANELGLKALGFLPRDFDLKSAMVQVYSEEIAAFYDPRTKTMHLIQEPEQAKSPSLLERLLGKTGGFDKDENQTVIAHEMTHALADQHFDLKALQDAAKKDDDQALAIAALIEGEATLTMLGAQMGDFDGVATTKLPAEDLDATFSLLGSFLPMFGGKTLRESPPILRDSMLFPYLRGLVFCAKLANDGGWEAIDQAYRSPPASTEQVLHPEKYTARPDPPQAIAFGELEPGEGWKLAGQNTVGEFQTAVLLRRHDGKRAAAGWDGDRYAVFEGPDGKLGLVWLSTWDSEEDARQFARAYARYQTVKLGDDAEEPEDVPDALRRTQGGAAYLIERRGTDVAVVEGFDPAAADRLLQAAFAAKKSEKAAPKPPDALPQ
jgi:hypothetical protein